MMKSKAFTVKMDSRENHSKIKEILTQKFGIRVVNEKLNVGDYIIDNEIVIERKTTLDFAQSIIDGRLFRQTANMKKYFDFSILIIEGRNIYNTSIDIHPHAIKGALVNMILVWQIPVLFAENAKETALLIWLIGSQNVPAYKELSYRPGRRPKRLRKRQLYILRGFPQVGPKLAVQLLDYFGSVEKVITTSDKELMKVRGLGKIKAKKIKEVVSKDF